jgi:hypothetical protein
MKEIAKKELQAIKSSYSDRRMQAYVISSTTGSINAASFHSGGL